MSETARPASAQDRLRALIEAEHERLRASFPAGGAQLLLSLVRARDRAHLATTALAAAPAPDLAHADQCYALGWSRALRLCFANLTDTRGQAVPGAGESDDWADRLLQACGRLGEAEVALAHCESGYLQLEAAEAGTFDAWATTRLMPTEWRERQDFAWWTAWLAQHHEPELRALLADRPRVQAQLRTIGDELCLSPDASQVPPAIGDYYRRLATLLVEPMACQHSYPAEAAIGGGTFALYRDLLVQLIALALRRHDLGEARGQRSGDGGPAGSRLAPPLHEAALVEWLAGALSVDPALAGRALRLYTLDRENIGYHCALPGAAPPPLLRLDEDRLVPSLAGLLAEPFIFLTRELRRRHPQEYHNAAHLREGVFRQDLYRLFGDRRFVTSPGRVELKRDKGEGGNLRTDLDAVVFDRKTGTLGVFELKAQDPFARTAEERQRQRDNFYAANRQVSAAAQWLQRNDPTALLARIDARAAKTFRAQRVQLFVLGRYLAHFAPAAGVPEPDRRAAWGSWPQILRVTGGRPFGPSDANPLASLHQRLSRDTPLQGPPTEPDVREVLLDSGRLRVYPSFAAYRGAAG